MIPRLVVLAREAVEELKAWYPPISRTEEWSRTPPPDPGPETWLLNASDGRGYGHGLRRITRGRPRRPAERRLHGAKTTAIGGLPEGDAADALRAAGWRVRIGERDGVVQQNVGSAPTWVNLVITDGLVTGFTIG